MHEGCLAHHARWAADAPADTNPCLIELCVRAFEYVLRGAFAFFDFRLVLSEILDNRRDGVFIASHTAALKLVRIDVADKAAQLFKVRGARRCLVVLFYERDAHGSMVNSK